VLDWLRRKRREREKKESLRFLANQCSTLSNSVFPFALLREKPAFLKKDFFTSAKRKRLLFPFFVAGNKSFANLPTIAETRLRAGLRPYLQAHS